MNILCITTTLKLQLIFLSLDILKSRKMLFQKNNVHFKNVLKIFAEKKCPSPGSNKKKVNFVNISRN